MMIQHYFVLMPEYYSYFKEYGTIFLIVTMTVPSVITSTWSVMTIWWLWKTAFTDPGQPKPDYVHPLNNGETDKLIENDHEQREDEAAQNHQVVRLAKYSDILKSFSEYVLGIDGKFLFKFHLWVIRCPFFSFLIRFLLEATFFLILFQ